MNASTHRCPVTSCGFAVTVAVTEHWPCVEASPFLLDHCQYVAEMQTGPHAAMHKLALAMRAAMLGREPSHG